MHVELEGLGTLLQGLGREESHVPCAVHLHGGLHIEDVQKGVFLIKPGFHRLIHPQHVSRE
eukprot:1644264-Amphidinium_carterae.1